MDISRLGLSALGAKKTSSVAAVTLSSYILDIGSLVAYWKFDETSGAVADNAEGTAALDGDIVGATINQAGQVGQAYSFDEDADYVNVKSGAILGGLSTWTITALAKHTASANFQNVVYGERSAAANDICKMDFQDSDRRLNLVYRDDAGSLTQDQSDSAVSLNAWHYLGMTRSSATVEHFIDGLPDGTGTISGTTNFTDGDVESRIGGDVVDGNADFKGLIQHVAIFNAVLSDAQILTMAELAGLA